ncbi:PhnA-like protein [Streptomyces sp. BK340]|nr:PhnA-like protein [Streptomyces sp. BK340]
MGNVLQAGDTVVVVKALKVKGSPSGIKAGTKVRNIRLVDGGQEGLTPSLGTPQRAHRMLNCKISQLVRCCIRCVRR